MAPSMIQEIRECFNEPVKPVRRSLFYHLGLLLVTVVMVLLPIVYFMIVTAAAYGVYYHATHNHSLVSSYSAGMRWRLLVYAGPLVIGSILVIFLAKPLIPRFGKRGKPLYIITEKNEPQFYEFIHLICRAVNAPKPREIHLMLEPNAYAAFRRGAWSFFGSDLVLSIGMPLIASLTAGQLSGVIAHEMGHFSQGFGMRLSYVIESVNRWFVRAIYDDGSFEEKLGDASEQTGSWVGLILVLSQLFILLTKGVLWVFMALGYLVSNFFSRQMEYDADLYELRVAGSQAFETTIYSLPLMGIAWEKSHVLAMHSLQKGVLADDLTALVHHEAKNIASKNKDKIINSILAEDTHLFDTHPSSRDRITVAKRKPATGICRVRSSARHLFGDFASLSKNLTAHFYKEMEIPSSKLLPPDQYYDYCKNEFSG